jgi:hypothetical protein
MSVVNVSQSVAYHLMRLGNVVQPRCCAWGSCHGRCGCRGTVATEARQRCISTRGRRLFAAIAAPVPGYPSPAVFALHTATTDHARSIRSVETRATIHLGESRIKSFSISARDKEPWIEIDEASARQTRLLSLAKSSLRRYHAAPGTNARKDWQNRPTAWRRGRAALGQAPRLRVLETTRMG